MNQKHFFHLTALSPWPLITAIILMNTFLSLILLMSNKTNLFWGWLMLLIATSFIWWRDVNRESFNQGFHSTWAMSNMRYGMILFIVSEIMFFFSIFWGFFYSSLSPNIELSTHWPPIMISAVNPFDIPLLNTIILLTSGITVTLSHHFILTSETKMGFNLLTLTIMLGIYFTCAQLMEYWDTPLDMSSSSFSGFFFFATGFHGLHVFIGTLLISSMCWRLKLAYFGSYHHLGFESSIWYWHFVDVVWLFLFVFVYWWSFYLEKLIVPNKFIF